MRLVPEYIEVVSPRIAGVDTDRFGDIDFRTMTMEQARHLLETGCKHIRLTRAGEALFYPTPSAPARAGARPPGNRGTADPGEASGQQGVAAKPAEMSPSTRRGTRTAPGGPEGVEKPPRKRPQRST